MDTHEICYGPKSERWFVRVDDKRDLKEIRDEFWRDPFGFRDKKRGVGDTVLDLNASLGAFSRLVCETRVPPSRVISVETDVPLASLCKRNMALRSTGSKHITQSIIVGKEEELGPVLEKVEFLDLVRLGEGSLAHPARILALAEAGMNRRLGRIVGRYGMFGDVEHLRLVADLVATLEKHGARTVQMAGGYEAIFPR